VVSWRLIWGIAVLAFLICSCAGAAKKPVATDAELLQQAEEALAAKKYEKAEALLKKLMVEYPASDLVPRARLALGRVYYLAKKYPEAKAEIQKFLDLHPKHERSDEAHYYLGLVEFSEISSVDRDQSPARRALTEFETVLREAPDSRFAADAREKIEVCQEKLAGHELFVGRFYFRRGKYQAAVARFRYLLSHYPEGRSGEEALYYLGESYYRLKRMEEAKSAFRRLLEQYPDSRRLPDARRRLAELEVP